METPKIFESEYRFCLILWEHEPVKSTELVKLCQEELGWKKATTYTVIKRLAERGVLKSEDAVVTSLVSKEDVQAAEIDELVEKTFEGSLPAFIAALHDAVIKILSSNPSKSPLIFSKISDNISFGFTFDINCGTFLNINSFSFKNSIPKPNF